MNNRIFKINPLTGLLVAVLFMAMIWFLISGLWKLLSIFAPFMFIASFLLDKKVPLNYFKWLGKQYQVNLMGGLALTALSAIGFPFLIAFLFARSLMNYRMGRRMKQQEEELEGDYIEFEELEDPLDLPKLNKD